MKSGRPHTVSGGPFQFYGPPLAVFVEPGAASANERLLGPDINK